MQMIQIHSLALLGSYGSKSSSMLISRSTIMIDSESIDRLLCPAFTYLISLSDHQTQPHTMFNALEDYCLQCSQLANSFYII